MPNCDHLADVPHFVYRVYDSEDRLLYVGCTVDVKRRMYGHTRTAEWLPIADRLRLLGPFIGKGARNRALRTEARLILEERPVFNVKRHLTVAA